LCYGEAPESIGSRRCGSARRCHPGGIGAQYTSAFGAAAGALPNNGATQLRAVLAPSADGRSAVIHMLCG